ERLSHHCAFSLVELPEQKSRAVESEKLLDLAAPSDWIVALDEHGKPLTSVELSKYVSRAQMAAKNLLFLVGGDEGHGPPVLEKAHLVLSLSRMTLPHRLARLVLAEQLYRAFTILRGEPYHK